MSRAGILAFLALLVPLALRADVPVPPFDSLVTDQTTTLTPGKQAVLENTLRLFEARKGSQIAVLIVATTKPETIEQYSMRVVEQWKPGRRKIDDGALLLVARDDRKVRIEVGYGLEGALSDAVAAQIIAEDIVPRFRRDDFVGGITAGVNRMISVIEGERLPPSARSAQLDAPQSQGVFTKSAETALLVMLILIGAFAFYVAAGASSADAMGVLDGIVAGIIVWAVAGAVLSVAVGFILGVVVAIGVVMKSRRGKSGHGIGDGGSSWSSGSSSSGGDSFSGGGGGLFGGGGASGGWGNGGGGDGGGGGE